MRSIGNAVLIFISFIILIKTCPTRCNYATMSNVAQWMPRKLGSNWILYVLVPEKLPNFKQKLERFSKDTKFMPVAVWLSLYTFNIVRLQIQHHRTLTDSTSSYAYKNITVHIQHHRTLTKISLYTFNIVRLQIQHHRTLTKISLYTFNIIVRVQRFHGQPKVKGAEGMAGAAFYDRSPILCFYDRSPILCVWACLLDELYKQTPRVQTASRHLAETKLKQSWNKAETKLKQSWNVCTCNHSCANSFTAPGCTCARVSLFVQQ